MAFENPLLRPSNTRQAALRYLWSDEPESEAQPAPSSSIADFFGVDTGAAQADPTAPVQADPTAPVQGGGESTGEGASGKTTPYGGLFGGLPSLVVKGINAAVPGFGYLYGAAQGVAGAEAANNLQAEMEKWGGNPNVGTSKVAAGIMGMFGQTPEGLENAKAFASNFANEANMVGYITAISDPTIGKIADQTITQSGGQYNANDYGKVAADIANTIAAANEETRLAAESAYNSSSSDGSYSDSTDAYSDAGGVW
jgi:hypothetical protein